MNFFWLFLKFLPVVIFFGAPVTIFTTYGIAVTKGHVHPLLPYVSETGTEPPESCIFTFCLSLSSFFIMCVAYVRYRQVAEMTSLYPTLKVKPIVNRIALCIGFTSAVGLNIVASFQELAEFTVHLVGALLCFFSGTIYFIFQAVFTRRISPQAKALFTIRVILTVLCVLCLVGTFAPIHCAITQFKGEDMLQWREGDGGYELHLISAFSEWILVICFVSYMYTFFWDFRKFDMEPPVIKVRLFHKNKQKATDFINRKTLRNLKPKGLGQKEPTPPPAPFS